MRPTSARLNLFHSILGAALAFATIASAQQPAPQKSEAEQGIASAAQLEKKAPPKKKKSTEPHVAVETGSAVIIGEGIAGFYPKGMDAASAPHSIALLERPKPSGDVPANWAIRPEFSKNDEVFRARIALPAGVDLYGGGEVTGPLRRNDTLIKLWNTDNFAYKKDGGRRLYQSHPWVMGVRPDGSSFGIIFDSTWKAELDLTGAITFDAEGPAFPVYVIERASPQAVVKALGDLTGKMDLPPLWAVGYQQSRWSYMPDARVRKLAEEFRKRNLPCDVLWLDIDYMDGYRVFTYDAKRFPDPAGLNKHLMENGFHAVWMLNPGIKVDEAYTAFKDGLDKDVYVKTAAGENYVGRVWPGDCMFPDYTRPETQDWWIGWVKNFMKDGASGIWNDMNEPAIFGGPDGTMPEDNHHRGGGDLTPGKHIQYHNAYGMLMTRGTRAGMLAANPDRRPFVLTRANFLGGQRYAATWTGDNVSSDEHMILSVPMSLTLGLSGQPFNGPDLGGFSKNPTPELFGRWMGTGALFPFARGHAMKASKPKEPWEFGPEIEKTSRIALERRYRLLPFFYTLFREASVNGLPVMRPVFFAEPANPALRTEEAAFLLGSDLMVVPPWATDLPKLSQTWPEISLVEGDREDPHQARLRIRPGAIVPAGRVVQHTGENFLDPLTLLVCLDENGRATGQLYEDAGDGFAFRKGDYRLTTFEAERSGGSVRVRIGKTEGDRKIAPRPVVIEVIGPDGSKTTLNQTL